MLKLSRVKFCCGWRSVNSSIHFMRAIATTVLFIKTAKQASGPHSYLGSYYLFKLNITTSAHLHTFAGPICKSWHNAAEVNKETWRRILVLQLSFGVPFKQVGQSGLYSFFFFLKFWSFEFTL